jgi:hypothetical protein
MDIRAINAGLQGYEKERPEKSLARLMELSP